MRPKSTLRVPFDNEPVAFPPDQGIMSEKVCFTDLIKRLLPL